MKRYARVTEAKSCYSYIVPADEPLHLADLFDGAEIGAKYTIELIDMSPEEYDALPEFQGF